jgi:hypothetical protein
MFPGKPHHKRMEGKLRRQQAFDKGPARLVRKPETSGEQLLISPNRK